MHVSISDCFLVDDAGAWELTTSREFREQDRDGAPKPEPLAVFGPNGEKLKIATKAIEDPGRCFNLYWACSSRVRTIDAGDRGEKDA